MRTRFLAAGIAVLALAGGIAVSTIPASQAATSACGSTCAALASQAFGSTDVSAVSSASGTAGTSVIMAAAAPTSTEDWQVNLQGTVSSFYAAGLVNATVGKTWPTLNAYEYEWAPGGSPTGLCLGIGVTAAASGTPVALEPCGVDAKTLWIPLTIDTIGGYQPLISATDTVSGSPYVLTAPSAAGGQLTTHQMYLVGGTFAKHQMWQLLTGTL